MTPSFDDIGPDVTPQHSEVPIFAGGGSAAAWLAFREAQSRLHELIAHYTPLETRRN